MKELDEKTKNKIIALINALFPDAKIYLFGSRARGTNAPCADIDIALDAGHPISLVDIDEIKNILRESNIMYMVDVVDFAQADERFKQEIIRDRKIWKQ